MKNGGVGNRAAKQPGQTRDASLFNCFKRAGQYIGLRHGEGTNAEVATVRESADHDRDFNYSERHLQCVWYDDSLRPRLLLTASGEEVMVENPGCWNLEAGPDFLDAVLAVGPGKRRIAGDVEIHVRADDWRNHKHNDDPAYARVVAHVSYFPDTLPDDALPPGTVQIALRDALKSNPVFSFDDVDVTAYPYAALPVKATPCAEILSGWTPESRIAFLESAGEERLRMKACRIAEAMRDRGREQVFYEEIMCALGYKHNRQPFRQLAVRLPVRALIEECGKDAEKAYSLLLGVSGLLPAKTSIRWDDETKVFIRRLWDDWWKQQSKWSAQCLQREDWHLIGLRPQNHPARRMAAVALLFTAEPGLLAAVERLCQTDAEKWFRGAAESLRLRTRMDYWARRLSFSGKPQEKEIEIIGEGRIAAILSNVMIPFLAASGCDVAALLPHLPPEENNSLIRRMAYALFGRDHNPSLYGTGLRQQGLLQVFHDFCLSDKTACRNCRLAETLRSHSQT
jgi:hypothetical protein